MKKYLFVIASIILFLGGIYLGYALFADTKKDEVNSTVVLTALQSEGFLVSQNYIFNQTITIDRSTGSSFKDIFFGQTIEANANMKVSSGIDLSKLTQNDIQVTDKSMQIKLPAVETQSVELLGNIVLQNKQGVIKKIFDNDDGYNVAITKLRQEAMSAAQTEELRHEASENAKKEIKKFLSYIDHEREITITP